MLHSSKRSRAAWFRYTAGAAAVAAMAVSLAACGSSSSSGSTHKHYTIALVPGLTTDPFYITMGVGAKAEAKKLGVTLTWQGGNAFTAETQMPVVSSLLAKHPDALLIAPTDVTALKAPIQKFVNAGIPVFAVDTTINDTSLLTARITSDNVQGGKVAADAIAKLAHDKGDVAVLINTPGISTTDARRQGFIEEMKKYPNMKVVATEYYNDSASTAESQVRDLLLAHSNLVGVFGSNIYGAQGAGAAIAAAGKKGKVFVIGYDAEPATVKMLNDGAINGLVIQQPALEGKLAVEYAYDKLTGKSSKIPKYTQIPNVVATTANASDPNITKYYYMSAFSGS